jgi:long-chain acyl-CoA synthetase
MVSTLGEILPFAARRYGDRTALIVGSDQLTYRQLDQASNAFANGLVGAGVRPGDRVTLYGPNAIEWMIAYFAIAKTGAVVNPINVMLTPSEVGFIVQDSGARVIVASADKAEALMDLKGKGELTEIVAWGEKPPTGAIPFDLWL